MTIPGKATIALALSGGGVRAAVFHLGALARLAAGERLEQVRVLSTVSGGSLLSAMLFQEGQKKWPTSTTFINSVVPAVRKRLTSRSLEFRWMFRWPLHVLWSPLHFRGSALAGALRGAWGIKMFLDELPESPLWVINSTSYESGKNWRFTRNEMGDWKCGMFFFASPSAIDKKASRYRVAVATAAATSAAFPYVVGLIPLRVPDAGWFDVDPGTLTPKDPGSPCPPIRKVLRFWDGGVYDNLGLEPVYKPQEGIVSRTNRGQEVRPDFLLVSDASAPLKMDLQRATGLINPRTVLPIRMNLRMPDIATDQTRSLRVRMVMRDIIDGTVNGALLRLGMTGETIKAGAVADFQRIRDAAKEQAAAGYVTADSLSQSEVDAVAGMPTRLSKLRPEEFGRVYRHGFETCDAALCCYHPNTFAHMPYK